MKNIFNIISKQELKILKTNKALSLNFMLKIILKKLCFKFNIHLSEINKLICSLIIHNILKNNKILRILVRIKKNRLLNLFKQVHFVLCRTKFHYGERYGVLINLLVTKDGFQDSLDKKNNQKSCSDESYYNEYKIKKYRPDLTESVNTSRNPFQINQTKKLLIYTVYGNYYDLFIELKASLPLICHQMNKSEQNSFKNYSHILPNEYLLFLEKNLSKKNIVSFHQGIKYGLTIFKNEIIFCRDNDKVHRIHLIDKPSESKKCLFKVSSNFNRDSQLLLQSKLIITNCKLISLSSSKGISNNLSLIINHQTYYLNNLITNLKILDFYRLKLMQYQQSCNPLIRLDRNGLKANINKTAICRLCFEAARKTYIEEAIENKCYIIKNCLCSELFFGSNFNFGTCYNITIDV